MKGIPEWLIYLQMVLVICIIGSLFIKYIFEIKEGYLTYQIIFFGWPLYKKVIDPNQINGIKFKRVGWASKCAVIQVRKGINIRIFHFAPENVYIDLLDFAYKNDISIAKSKDYLLLER